MKNFFVAVAPVFLVGSVFATDYTWREAVDGEISNPDVWAPSGVPGEGDQAKFAEQGAYCATESADRTVGSVSVTNADVTIDLGGKSWTLTGPLSTYCGLSEAVLTRTTISNGTLNVNHGSTDNASGIIVSLKDSIATKGNLRITGKNTSVATKALWMGGMNSLFALDGGAKCEVAGEVRWGGNGQGGGGNEVLIAGEGTRFRQTALGSLTGNNVGDRLKFYFVDGADVSFCSMFSLSAGYGGRWNEMWVTNGSQVVFCNNLAVAQNANGRKVHENVCRIAGEGTMVSVTGLLYVAQSAISNRLHITDHAVVTQTVNSGATMMYCGWDGSSAGLGCGNEIRVDNGGEYYCVPSPSATYHSLYMGGGAYSCGNRIFVGSDAKFVISRASNDCRIGYAGGHDNGIVVSNGTFDVTTGWKMYFGWTDKTPAVCGSGNYVEFYGDHPIAYFGEVPAFNTGSKVIFHVEQNGYAVAPLNLRYPACNTSDIPAQLVLDVTNWAPEAVTSIPLVQTMRDVDASRNKPLLEELLNNVTFIGAKHPESYTVSLSADSKTLCLQYKQRKGLVLIFR